MKISKYNSSIELSDKFMLHYNALHDNFILSKNGYKISLNSSEKELRLLIDKGFVVDDEVDESKILIDKALSIITNDTSYHLTINPTLDCNFSCWYCYEEKRKGSMMNQDVLSSLQKLLKKLGDKYKHIHVSFFGGEPLLAFSNVIIPIYQTLETISCNSRCEYSTSYTTNGGLVSSKILSFLKEVKVKNMQITLDGHRDNHDKIRYYNNHHGSYDIIIKNITKILTCGISVTLRINYTPENINSVQYVVQDIVKQIPTELMPLLIVRFHQVWQTTDIDLSAEVDSLIEELISHGVTAVKPIFDNVNNPCYADYKHSALVNFNGDVYKCTAIDFLNTQRDGYLNRDGDIIWENNSNERRIYRRFENESCLHCRIQPICNGGCSQKPIQFGMRDYCLMGYNEDKKDQVIKDRFVSFLQRGKIKKTTI